MSAPMATPSRPRVLPTTRNPEEPVGEPEGISDWGQEIFVEPGKQARTAFASTRETSTREFSRPVYYSGKPRDTGFRAQLGHLAARRRPDRSGLRSRHRGSASGIDPHRNAAVPPAPTGGMRLNPMALVMEGGSGLDADIVPKRVDFRCPFKPFSRRMAG
jgi:hypothetical protein